MSRHPFGRVIFAVSLALGAAVAASSCSSDTPSEKVVGCSLNSDCDAPLICVYQRCHTACNLSSDCPQGERCVAGDSAAAPHVCQLPIEASCSSATSCDGDQVCTSTDMQCRTPCQSTSNCVAGDYCELAGSQSVCFVTGNSSDQAVLLADGVLEAGAPDSSVPLGAGGSSGAPGAAGASSASGGASSSSAGGSSGAAGASGDADFDAGACTIRFGAVALGDTSASYSTGIASRTPTGLLIVDGYGGPDQDSGSENRIDTQSFDGAGNSQAAAASVLVTRDDQYAGRSDFIEAAATSPSGVTAVVFYDESTYGEADAPELAFFSPTQQLVLPVMSLGPETSVVGQPDIQWVKDRFVIAWLYKDGGSVAIKVAMYGADGSMITGIGSLPTDDVAGRVFTGGSDYPLSVAASGAVVAIGYRNYSKAYPMLSLLDLSANPIGDPIQIAAAESAQGFALAGTAQGFVALWHESQTALDVDAGLFGSGVGHAAFVSLTGELGASVRVPGDSAATVARGSSDGTRAGFALLYADGLRFGVALDDLSTGFRVSGAIAAAAAVASDDEIGISASAASKTFALSYFSFADHRTRAVAEGCSLLSAD